MPGFLEYFLEARIPGATPFAPLGHPQRRDLLGVRSTLGRLRHQGWEMPRGVPCGTSSCPFLGFDLPSGFEDLPQLGEGFDATVTRRKELDRVQGVRRPNLVEPLT